MSKNYLFISKMVNYIGGGSVISRRNYEIFCRLFPREKIMEYGIEKKRNVSPRLLLERCFKHFVNGVNVNIISEISNIAKGCEHVWIDNSSYGAIAKHLKKNNYKGNIYVFFHNIEYVFQKRSFFKRMLYPIFNLPIKNAEKDAAQYADLIFVLTERDRNTILNWGFSTPVVLLPSSLKDSYRSMDDDYKRKELLFVGSNFYANANGIIWFIDKVMPHINVHLTIVGSHMDELPIRQNEKISIHGFVEDLGVFYTRADCVIAPIFEGSGMKTKTTEALMWGKFIIGTTEAFCGFDITDDVGICCKNSADFINAINNRLKRDCPKFNASSRNLFLEKYSNEKSIVIVQDAIKQINPEV